ncbi:DUF4224 domain-containing protein [Undibacterium curvum]|uniref:DUF4224 domain-containing protein n=1 Tax=Undibacterium curvum TaxID=2762294 RepID=UPI003D12FD00
MSNTFLTHDEIVDLTDRRAKSKQIESLRVMGIHFHISATGHPKVARSAIDGKRQLKDSPTWQSKAPASTGWQSAAR